jgi:hypothetical protein
MDYHQESISRQRDHTWDQKGGYKDYSLGKKIGAEGVHFFAIFEAKH